MAPSIANHNLSYVPVFGEQPSHLKFPFQILNSKVEGFFLSSPKSNLFKGVREGQTVIIKAKKHGEPDTNELRIYKRIQDSSYKHSKFIVPLLDAMGVNEPCVCYSKIYFPFRVVYVFPMLKGNLYADYLGKKLKFSLENAERVFFQTIAAIDHLKLYGIIHCDLRPENIFWDEEKRQILIIDFDIALVDGEKVDRDLIQPLQYSHPITFSTKQVTSEIDKWSAACVGFEVYTGKLLFDERLCWKEQMREQGLINSDPVQEVAFFTFKLSMCLNDQIPESSIIFRGVSPHIISQEDIQLQGKG